MTPVDEWQKMPYNIYGKTKEEENNEQNHYDQP